MTTRTPHFPRTLRLRYAMLACLAMLTLGGDDRVVVQASRLAGISHGAVTGVQVQNLDALRSATIHADFVPFSARGGTPPMQVTRPGVPAGSAVNVFAPLIPEIPDGLYAVHAQSDRRIAAIARTDWSYSGAAALYSSVTPGTDVFLPLALIAYYGQTSLVAVQNTDFAHAATIHVALMANGQGKPAAERDYTIQAGSGVALDLAAEFVGVPANTPGGFLGSLRVTSALPVGMMSFVDIATSQKAVYAFEGGPASAGGKRLYAPLVRNRQQGPYGRVYSTGIAVANPGATAVSVTVTYIGSYKACAGKTYRDGPLSVPPFSSTVFYQPASTSLPADCVATAVIEADGDVFAIVNDALNLTEQAAAYNAMPDAQGATLTYLPLVRRQHTAMKLTTGVQAMNIGAAPANVEMRFFDDNGTEVRTCGPACRTTVAPLAAATFYPSSSHNGMPGGSYGSALITSDQPVVVIVNDVSEVGAMDMATYNGIKGDGPASPDDPTVSFDAFVTFVARGWVKPATSND